MSSGHVVLYFSNGVPDRFQTQNTPRDYQSSMWQNYFFIQDRWQVGRRLVLNLGLRWDNYDSHYPAQGNTGVGPYAQPTSFAARTVAVFNNWVPRIGAVYDLFGNTKTALKFNYGRYAEDPDIALSNSANPNTEIITNRYAWDGTLPITPELVARSRLLQTTGQLTPVAIDPDLTNSITDQFLAGIDHELLPNLAIGGTFVRTLRYDVRGSINLAEPTSGYAPVSAIDPGPDGLVGTTDDRPFTVYERLGVAGSEQFLTNFDTGEYDDTWEVNATKRFRNGGQIITGWDRTWRRLGDAISNDPNQQLYDGPNRTTTSQWTFKAIGSYALPWHDVGVSGSYMGQKGEPYARTVQFTPALLVNHPAALAQGNTTVTVEPSQRVLPGHRSHDELPCRQTIPIWWGAAPDHNIRVVQRLQHCGGHRNEFRNRPDDGPQRCERPVVRSSDSDCQPSRVQARRAVRFASESTATLGAQSTECLPRVESGVAVPVHVARRHVLPGQPFVQCQFYLVRVSEIGPLGTLSRPASRWHAEHVRDFLLPLHDAYLPNVAGIRSVVMKPQRDSGDRVQEAAFLEQALAFVRVSFDCVPELAAPMRGMTTD